MRFHYDKSADALYIRFDESPYAESDEVGEDVIFDYDKKGRIVGIEILGASRKLSPTFRSALQQNIIPLSIGPKRQKVAV